MNKQAELEQAYWNGFRTKCAEYGVDAEKLAQETQGKENVRYGGLLAETLGGIPASIPLAAVTGGQGPNVANLVAALTAAASDPRTEDEQRAQRGGKRWANAVPGVGTHNLWKRLGRTASDYEEYDGKREGAPRKSNLKHEIIGDRTAFALPVALGAGIGALGAGRRGAVPGALAGLGVSTVAGTAAALLALAKRRRNTGAQMEYEQTASRPAQYLIPGLAQYNVLKRLGYSAKYDADQDERA